MTTTHSSFKPGDRVVRLTNFDVPIASPDSHIYAGTVLTVKTARDFLHRSQHLTFFERPSYFTYSGHDFALAEKTPPPTIPVVTTREAILSEASALIVGDRQADYGPPSESMQRIATGWEVIFGTEVAQWQVAAAMAWLKIARAVETPTKRDSWVDGAGYIAIAGEVAGA